MMMMMMMMMMMIMMMTMMMIMIMMMIKMFSYHHFFPFIAISALVTELMFLQSPAAYTHWAPSSSKVSVVARTIPELHVTVDVRGEQALIIHKQSRALL
jgi:hypothetical protein